MHQFCHLKIYTRIKLALDRAGGLGAAGSRRTLECKEIMTPNKLISTINITSSPNIGLNCGITR